jgi:hypothetical protein
MKNKDVKIITKEEFMNKYNEIKAKLRTYKNSYQKVKTDV